MNSAASAINDARYWAEELQKAEFKGLGDTREAARYRVSRKTGVSESYLKRLRYRFDEMTDVAGSAYRSLMLAYEGLCEKVEAKADAMERERLGRTGLGNAAFESPLQTGEGSVAAAAEQEMK